MSSSPTARGSSCESIPLSRDRTKTLCLLQGGESKAFFSFLWFRDHRRYFYVNEQSGESQWEFPDGEEEEEGQILENKAETLPKAALKEKTEFAGESTDNATGTVNEQQHYLYCSVFQNKDLLIGWKTFYINV